MEEEQKTDGCVHEWKLMNEDCYGEMDYSSYGGGVKPFAVRTYVCAKCGALKKESAGDFNGDPQEFLEITEAERKQAEYYLQNAGKRVKQEPPSEVKREDRTNKIGLLVLLLILALFAFVWFVFYKAEKDSVTKRASTDSAFITEVIAV